MLDGAGPIAHLRKHLTGATRLDSLSESFSIFVYEALQEQLANVNLRLLLWDGSLKGYPLNGLSYENIQRARLEQHRVAHECLAWAEQRANTRTLRRRTRDTWVAVAGPFPFAVNGAGLEAESLGLVASDTLHFPQEFTDAVQPVAIGNQFDRLWNDDSATTDVREDLLDSLRLLCQDNAPESIYLRILTSLFQDFIDETGDETASRGRTGFYETVVWKKLYKFQRDGVLGAIEKLERHNGCIIADSVGLGKTFEALAVIKYYELRNDRVLVLAPKRLRENWTIYCTNDVRNPLVDDRFNYDVLNHTDLGRTSGTSGDVNLSHINWGNYDLVVIDESHNAKSLVGILGMDYIRLLDLVTIARSRKHIEKYYGTADVGEFPERENNVVHLLRVGLLKRLESSVSSLGLTLQKILDTVDGAISRIERYEQEDSTGMSIQTLDDLSNVDLADAQFEDAVVGGNVKVFLEDLDRHRWRQHLEEDRGTIAHLLAEVRTEHPPASED
jgi:hypothetical protein